MKIVAVLIIAAAIALVVFLVVPAPSFQRSVVLTNQITAQIEVQCRTLDGKRKKAFRIMPNEHAEFVYFVGDHDGRTTIPVVVTAKNLADGKSVTKQFELPVATQPSGLGISAEWFTPQKD